MTDDDREEVNRIASSKASNEASGCSIMCLWAVIWWIVFWSAPNLSSDVRALKDRISALETQVKELKGATP